jgi:hypothetical protein
VSLFFGTVGKWEGDTACTQYLLVSFASKFTFLDSSSTKQPFTRYAVDAEHLQKPDPPGNWAMGEMTDRQMQVSSVQQLDICKMLQQYCIPVARISGPRVNDKFMLTATAHMHKLHFTAEYENWFVVRLSRSSVFVRTRSLIVGSHARLFQHCSRASLGRQYHLYEIPLL